MNEVLLLMWFADVASDLKQLLLLAGLGGVIVYTLLMGGFILDRGSAWEVGSEEDKKRKPRLRWAALAIAVILTAALLPSKQTLHLAAAARAAQLASQSEIGTLATEVLKEALQQLKEKTK